MTEKTQSYSEDTTLAVIFKDCVASMIQKKGLKTPEQLIASSHFTDQDKHQVIEMLISN